MPSAGEIAALHADQVELIRWLKVWHDAAPQDPLVRGHLPLLSVAELSESMSISPPVL